ncbi:hypothetical protein SETIT_5G012400v2 [Setaria italica]|uniref:Uncharacterized protein n=1 Tax=Setaria italica TaxID=4555 RepID=K3XQM6_SETIT|nr:hypothetical protein SETIT_5G012400v2 [Setaria italica]
MTSPIAQLCELPTELWGEIISRIDVLDVMSFSSTCKSLELVCKTLGATIPKSGTAMLVTSQPDPDGWGVDDDLRIGKFGLHDVCNALSFCCVIEDLQRRICLGGKGDWLVTTNTGLDWEILNPMTRSKVPLLSLANNLSGIELPSYRKFSVVFPPFTRDVRRVVLSRTPSHADGYEAIALFSDGLLTYTTQGENVWRVLKNPTDRDDSGNNYYPEVFLDVIVYHGYVIAVEENGDIDDMEKDFIHWEDLVVIPWAKLPFFITSTEFKCNIIYMADVGEYDVAICSLDFPVDKKEHLLKAWTIRTPMWFRPSAHAKGNH